jgi:hypothetical protein
MIACKAGYQSTNLEKKYIDFLGTAYNDKRRPATFNHDHVVRYQKRVKNGLWMFGPEHLEELLKAGDVKVKDGALAFTRSEDAQQYSKSSQNWEMRVNF